MDIGRRGILKMGLVALAASASFPVIAVPRRSSEQEKRLSFYNTHTGEDLRVTYWERGHYVPEALREINFLLRDYLNGEVKQISPKLLDFLYGTRQKLGSSQPFHVISAYRSPASNRGLAKRSRGVARKSLHLEGKAIDIFLPHRDLKTLHRAALGMQAGGVGYYPKSNFVHLDVGPVRKW